MYDVKICWHFYSSALNDRRDLGNEEQMSVLACRTKELDISTMLRPVFPPLLVSAGLAFCLRLIGWPLPFAPTVWTLTCQKKAGTTLTMSFLFPLAAQIFAWQWQSLTEPFVWGSWGERQSERGREKERRRGERGHNSDHMFNVTLIILN